jgi:hypothetical protein
MRMKKRDVGSGLVGGLTGLIVSVGATFGLGNISGCNTLGPIDLPKEVTVHEDDIKERKTLFEFTIKGPKPYAIVTPKKGDGGVSPPFKSFVDCEILLPDKNELNCTYDIQDKSVALKHTGQEWDVAISAPPSSINFGVGFLADHYFGFVTVPLFHGQSHITTIRYEEGPGNVNLDDRVNALEDEVFDNGNHNGNDNGDDRPYVIGDGFCDRGLGETISNSEEDCRPYVVGDDVCSRLEGETFVNSPDDCRPYSIGDGICSRENGESIGNSPEDCVGESNGDVNVNVDVDQSQEQNQNQTAPPAPLHPQPTLPNCDPSVCIGEEIIGTSCSDDYSLNIDFRYHACVDDACTSFEDSRIEPCGLEQICDTGFCVEEPGPNPEDLYSLVDVQFVDSTGSTLRPILVEENSSRTVYGDLVIPEELVQMGVIPTVTRTGDNYSEPDNCFTITSVGEMQDLGVNSDNFRVYTQEASITHLVDCPQVYDIFRVEYDINFFDETRTEKDIEEGVVGP